MLSFKKHSVQCFTDHYAHFWKFKFTANIFKKMFNGTKMGLYRESLLTHFENSGVGSVDNK